MGNDTYDDEMNDEESGRSRIPDSIRKALLTGVSAVLMTEEGIRNVLGDMRLPKDALAYMIQQTERTRRELFRAVSDEIKGFLSGVDMTGEIRKALTGMRVQVHAELTFIDESTAKTTVKAVTIERKKKERPKKGKRRRKNKSKS